MPPPHAAAPRRPAQPCATRAAPQPPAATPRSPAQPHAALCHPRSPTAPCRRPAQPRATRAAPQPHATAPRSPTLPPRAAPQTPAAAPRSPAQPRATRAAPQPPAAAPRSPAQPRATRAAPQPHATAPRSPTLPPRAAPQTPAAAPRHLCSPAQPHAAPHSPTPPCATRAAPRHPLSLSCRENVLRNLADKAFDRPICEALLNQKYFNGIGNYLRAEILYRLKIPPFEKARTVLEALKHREQDPSLTLSKKLKLKRDNPDLLELCHTVPMEVVKMGGKGYDPEHSDDSTAFKNWLQCYAVPGMCSLRDSNGRTIWFQVTTRASKRRPRGAGAPPKPTEEEEKVVADEAGQGRGRRRKKAAAAPASSDPEAPVKVKRSRASARRGSGMALCACLCQGYPPPPRPGQHARTPLPVLCISPEGPEQPALHPPPSEWEPDAVDTKQTAAAVEPLG
ncbi:endonuclease 8-like 1 isoform X2 [Rhea pennata]|uniref:endonuclease 8-like 1 isoform X2 n=1 Tax=Rhea pennata TaxID=8795 RepID=UPI002E2752A5